MWLLLLATFIELVNYQSAYGQKLIFHYKYDYSNEVLINDSLQSSNWYVPIEKDYINFCNANMTSRVKYTIDAQTLSGIYWYDHGYQYLPLSYYEMPTKEQYMIQISSEGVGFEGHATVTFLRFTKKQCHVDASYGMFSDNNERKYASSFYTRDNGKGKYLDDIFEKYKHQIPGFIGTTAFFNFQLYSQPELAKQRFKNTLFFGVVPPEIVKSILKNSVSSTFIELTPEEYQYRLYVSKSHFGNAITIVNQAYLFGQFQKDWRYLFSLNTVFENTLINPYSFVIDTKSYASGPNNQEQLLFPHISIQHSIMMNLANTQLAENSIKNAYSNYRHRIRTKTRISQDFSVKILDANTDRTFLIFDTSHYCDLSPLNRDKGYGLRIMSYKGQIKGGCASGKGQLLFGVSTCHDSLTTNGYLSLDGNFNKGLPDGYMRFYQHYPGKTVQLLMSGVFNEGKQEGEFVKYNLYGNERSRSTYKAGNLNLEQRITFHNYDPFFLVNDQFKISDFYTEYVKDEQFGIEIPSDTAYTSDNYSVFYSENIINIQFQDCRVGIPYYRDFKTMRLQPSGTVMIYYSDGSKLLSNWDPVNLIRGKSYYFWPKYNRWIETMVTDGIYNVTVITQQPPQKKSFFQKVASAATHILTEPIQLGEEAISVGLGKASINDLANSIVASYLQDIGSVLQIDGSVVKFLGDHGNVLFTVPETEYKYMFDYYKAATTIDFQVQSLLLTSKLFGINYFSNVKKQLDNLFDRGQGYYNKALETAEKVLFNGLSIAGLVSDKLGLYMTLASQGFPKAINNPYINIPLDNYNIKLNITNIVFEEVLNRIFSTDISINKDLVTTVGLNGATIIQMDDKNKSISASFSNGKINIQLGAIKNTFTINGCNLQFLPEIRYNNGKIYMDIHAVVTYLDLADANPVIDKMLAWALQLELLNDRPICSIEISELVNLKQSFLIGGKKDLKTNSFPKQPFYAEMPLEYISLDFSGQQLVIKGQITSKSK